MSRSTRRTRAAGRKRSLLIAFVLLSLPLAGCFASPAPGSLPPTLTMESSPSGVVAVQNGIPVPSFDFQPRPRLDLDGPWRVDRRAMDTDLSLTDRSSSLPRIEAAAGGRHEAGYDDSAWPLVDVPGTIDEAPSGAVSGAWYRRSFDVPATWAGLAATLKFGAVNYIADVWLNGRHLGYHEGGSTPFAFGVEDGLRVGATNEIAVRVDVPAWGTRTDVVPWGLADWWEYGGITQSVWLEASSPVLVSRADVVPHLDGADVSLVVENRSDAAVDADVTAEILPARIEPTHLLDPDPRTLVPSGSVAVASGTVGRASIDAGAHAVLDVSFAIGAADPWTVGKPALYVLHVSARSPDGSVDDLWQTFGLRRIAVDPEAPRLLLNGAPILLAGAATHTERIEPASGAADGVGRPMTDGTEALAQLRRAAAASADFIRTGHTPALPALLALADRLGFAIWEEIPLYHFSPFTFDLAMRRGIPQQMLREMALRDMDRPSVLFYGLANESTGGQPRADAVAELNRVVKAIDPTRLTGQAAYGFDPTDPTSEALDVAGFTFYHGVFYGEDVGRDTLAALGAAHRQYPKKPILILEFGRWADPPDGPARQVEVFRSTVGPILAARDDRAGGYVGGVVWWALDDYYTMRPGITIERFGMYDAAGIRRPVADLAARTFATAPQAETGASAASTTGGIGHAVVATGATRRLVALLAYGIAFAFAALAFLLVLTLRAGGRPWPHVGRSRGGEA